MTDSKTCPCCGCEALLRKTEANHEQYRCFRCNLWSWKEGPGYWWQQVEVTETKVTTRREVREFKPGGFKVT